MRAAADERDLTMLAERMEALDRIEGPRVGDFVRFADGVERRISHHWTDGEGWDGGIQTSDGGSWYLGNGYVSMSGSLYGCIPTDSLKLTDERKRGSVWIFHHDFAGAGRGVDLDAEFRVYVCAAEAPR